ncbi:MAG: nitrate ABC transporter ATP-binding protein [Acidobacteria bacterium RIFCSPLOWO2_12_FULL_67_14]|nr:MAG: nitrate ABC transporter ATP-binding protein [Acidobacteria bacterium RIFCSPLOWO2_02_FULL_67_21]OFW37753.1 MAG: nitrate ABC transporter ATP-binding protein [Acidobacteria bacterium RIFCSPLOWO2_12_FULL_67_14]
MLRIRNLTIAYDHVPVLERINLDVARGAFVGPSGCGKTSLLRAITRLLQPQTGTVDLDVAPADIGFLFQDDALLPWRTARENVALGQRIRGVASPAAEEQASQWLASIGLAGFEARYPRQLSGGQRKRVALAQVLALEPRLLLMDEPFASLDAIARTRITEELIRWVERQHLTVLLVTHDFEEVITLSDVVYVLSQGPGAGIQARHAIDIPRPRHVLESRGHPRFAPLLQELWDELAGADVAGDSA